MKVLGDGSVLPHNFSTEPNKGAKGFLHNNLSLRSGMVTDIIYPDDDASVSKQVIEYNVAIAQFDPKTGVNLSMIRNCKANNMFGSRNNNLTYTLKPGERDETGVYKNTSIVLVLCINGISDAGSAVIIGALANDDGPGYASADGQFYDFNFNGINWKIDKDGAYSITFNSPLDDKGQPTNVDASGTVFRIDKDGTVRISDNEGQFWSIDRVNKTSTWSNGADYVTIDKANKKVILNSSGDLSTHSDKSTILDSNKALSVSATEDLSLSSQANVASSSKGNMSQKSGGTWDVNVTGDANIKAGGNLMMQGGAIMQAKGTMNLIGDGTVPVAAVGVSIVFGIGNLGAPVISQILTGSATVFVGT